MTEREVLELIRQHLPKLMQEDPQVRQWVRELVAQYGVTREEWNALLERLDRLTEAVEHNTEQIQRLWQAVEHNTEQIQRLWQAIGHSAEQIQRLWQAVEHNTEQIQRLWQAVDALREELHQMAAELRAEIQLMRETYDRAIAELREEMQRGFTRLERRIDALGARWGIFSESAFREGLRGILEQRFGVQVLQWRHYDQEGFVMNVPTWVEADILIRNEEHLLIELKSHVSRADMAEFYRLGQLYQQVTGITPHLVVISPFIDRRAKDLAYLWGIATYTHPEEVEIEPQ